MIHYGVSYFVSCLVEVLCGSFIYIGISSFGEDFFFYDSVKDLIDAIVFRLVSFFYTFISRIWSFESTLHFLYVPILYLKFFTFFAHSRFSTLSLSPDILFPLD